MKSWNAARRRLSSLVVVAATAFVVLVALALYLLTDAAWLEMALWSFVGVVLMLLVFQVLLLVLQSPQASPMGASAASAGGAAMSAEAGGMATEAPKVLTLRCGDCGTIFDIQDFGVRPLFHTCPGCGHEGVLKEGDGKAPAGPAGPAGATEPKKKRLKLRCGGCAHIFVLEDPGSRPLRHSCPNCGRKGELK